MIQAVLRYNANQATLLEASEICDVPLTALQNAVKAGRIDASRRGHKYWVDLRDVEDWDHARGYTKGQEMADRFNDGEEVPALAVAFQIKCRSVERSLQRQGINPRREPTDG